MKPAAGVLGRVLVRSQNKAEVGFGKSKTKSSPSQVSSQSKSRPVQIKSQVGGDVSESSLEVQSKAEVFTVRKCASQISGL